MMQNKRIKTYCEPTSANLENENKSTVESAMFQQSELNFVKTIQEIEEIANDITRSLQNTKKLYSCSIKKSTSSTKSSLLQEIFPRSFIIWLP